MKRFNVYSGLSVSAWLLAVLVIVAELIPAFKETIKTIFTHHWIGKAILITLAFVIFGLLLNKTKFGGYKDEDIAWYSTLGSLLLILLFYIWHFYA